MPVPETAMNEDRLAARGKDQIGRARQAAVMQAVTEPHCMDETANEHFGLAVARLDTRHAGAALGWCQSVHMTMIGRDFRAATFERGVNRRALLCSRRPRFRRSRK